MNILLIVVLAIIISFTIKGYKKGLVKTVLSFVLVVASIIITIMISPSISKVVRNNQSLNNYIENKVETTLNLKNKNNKVVKKTAQIKFIEELELPEIIKEKLLENNTSDVYDMFDISKAQFYEYIIKYITSVIINVICYILSYIVSIIILKAAAGALNIVTMLPIIKQVNKFSGLIVGLAEGIVLVWVFFAFINVFGATDFGKSMYSMIIESRVLSFIYNNNFILNSIMSIKF